MTASLIKYICSYLLKPKVCVVKWCGEDIQCTNVLTAVCVYIR